VGCNSAVDDAQRFAHQFWAAGEQESQLERKAQHLLADGFMRQHGVSGQVLHLVFLACRLQAVKYDPSTYSISFSILLNNRPIN
jgi:hypothetical protein